MCRIGLTDGSPVSADETASRAFKKTAATEGHLAKIKATSTSDGELLTHPFHIRPTGSPGKSASRQTRYLSRLLLRRANKMSLACERLELLLWPIPNLVLALDIVCVQAR